MVSVELSKDSIRQVAFAKRLQIPLEKRKSASALITQSFLKAVPLPEKGKVISAYSPINGEVDVRDLLLQLSRMGYICALPHVFDSESRLSFLKWDEHTELKTSIYGIPEPDPSKALEYTPDLLIMPLVAFDKKGNRLGYGSGNFDRTFDYIKKIQPFMAVAVAYEDQYFEEIPTGYYDYPMDMIITEKSVYDFRGKNK